jgi:hypothetical protein
MIACGVELGCAPACSQGGRLDRAKDDVCTASFRRAEHYVLAFFAPRPGNLTLPSWAPPTFCT